VLGNHDPIIESLSADRAAIVASGVVNVTLVASDPDGDPLQITWEADLGTLSATTGEGPVAWTAPPERGNPMTVTVTVSDGQAEAVETASVDVLGFLDASSGVDPGLELKDVDFASAEEGWIAGGGETQNVPHILHYTNGSWATETQDPDGHLHAVSAVAANDVWISGGAGLTYHWDGSAWTGFMMNGGCVHGMDFLNAHDGWVTPAHGQPYMRHYAGGAVTSWTIVDIAATNGLNGVSMATPDAGWVVCNFGMMMAYDGTSWTEQSSPTSFSLYAVAMTAADNGWAVGDLGTILHYDGSAWTLVESPTQSTLFKVRAWDANNVWAVGADGAILFFNGTSWSQVPSPVTEELHGVHAISESEAWVVGHGSTILHLE